VRLGSKEKVNRKIKFRGRPLSEKATFTVFEQTILRILDTMPGNLQQSKFRQQVDRLDR
jgi:hypothetical protein